MTLERRAAILLLSALLCGGGPVAPSAQSGGSRLQASTSTVVRPAQRAGPPSAPTAVAQFLSALSLRASDWDTISTPAAFRLVNESSGGLAFDFPAPPNSMGYLYHTRPPRVLAGSISISLEVTTKGMAAFNYAEPGNGCVAPATVRPFIWANQNGWGDYDRWWSNPTAHRLDAGSTTLVVPLTPDRWSSVNGRFGNSDAATLAAFQAALSSVSRVGVTFGGGCFFGHGVDVSGGSARFVITRLAFM